MSVIANPPKTFQLPRMRWTICALLFFATTINYVNRQVFSVLAPELQKTIGWSEIEYGYMIAAFQTAYAIGLAVAGTVIDRLGTRIGYALAMGLWSIAAMAHALASSALGFGVARFFLGLGEAGNFPAAIKTTAEWFPARERALATGIFNAGSNVGAIVVPLTVPLIALYWGWRWAFVLGGAIGLVWLLIWLPLYRKPGALEVDPDEPPAPPAAKLGWPVLLPLKQTWAFALAKFLTDPIWWFYLYWLPKFLNARYGLSLDKIGAPLIVVYVAADIGSVGGGWLSSRLIARGWSVNRGRKIAMLICALAVLPLAFLSYVDSVWIAVALVSLAAAAHQGWSANLFTLASDTFPQTAVGSVVGLGGTAGAIGGILFAAMMGFLLEFTHSYIPGFVTASLAYIIALAAIHLLLPKLERAEL